MNDLLRDLAPITAAGWSEIEKEATRTLKAMLAARRLVDFEGPLGLEAAAIGTGRLKTIGAPGTDGVEAHLREVQAFVELRSAFTLDRGEINAIERGAKDPDLDPVIAAARRIAIAEDRAIFHGYAEAGIRGICEADSESGLTLGDDYQVYPEVIASAISRLRDEGVDGPYAVALCETCYKGLTETTKAGYPVLDHVKRIVGGPIVWAPGLAGAVVVSQRGGDFELVVGRDLSIGYLSHDAHAVELYLEESFTFRLLSPQAAVPLAYQPAGGNTLSA